MTGEALNLKERLNLTRKQHIGWHLHGIGPRSGQEQHGGGELDSFGLHANSESSTPTAYDQSLKTLFNARTAKGAQKIKKLFLKIINNDFFHQG